MSSLQARAQVIFEHPEKLAAEVMRLNRSISANCPGNSFITFFVAVLDPSSDEVIYCNAGHNPPLLLRGSGEVDALDATGIPLGISAAARYEQNGCRLNEGDMLVLFSDGITEACQPGMDEDFGERRLISAVRRMRGRGAAGALEEVKKDLLSFTGGIAADDVTLVIAGRCVGTV
jgi:sigma-B regulation protein RsbU (phosphoserine phosphatase)